MSKKTPQNPLSDEDVVKFDGYMHFWLQVLNLKDWRVIRSKARSTNLAEVQIFPEHRLVRYKVGKDWGNTPITEQSLSTTALHECLHILFDPMLRIAAESEDVGHDLKVLEAEHAVIAVLEKILGAQE